MKDELGGNIMKELVGLKAKTHRYYKKITKIGYKHLSLKKKNYLEKNKIDGKSLIENPKESQITTKIRK